MTEPMQADGKGTQRDDSRLPETGKEGGGDSSGAAYRDKDLVKPKGEQSGFLGHGGQSENAYHGPVDDEASGKDPKAVAKGG